MPSDRANGVTNVLEAIRQGFSNPLDGMLGILLLVFLVLLLGVIAVLFSLQRRQESRQNLDDPQQLFDELAAAHGLSSADRAMLQNQAKRDGAAGPELLFVRPSLWTEAVSANPGLSALHDRIFSTAAVEEPVSPPQSAE